MRIVFQLPIVRPYSRIGTNILKKRNRKSAKCIISAAEPNPFPAVFHCSCLLFSILNNNLLSLIKQRSTAQLQNRTKEITGIFWLLIWKILRKLWNSSKMYLLIKKLFKLIIIPYRRHLSPISCDKTLFLILLLSTVFAILMRDKR